LVEQGDESVLDLGIIGAGCRFEISGYTTSIGLAQPLKETEVASLLKASLAEEEAAYQKLRKSLLKSVPTEA
jgi:ferritin-like metal-binding protein YciE